MKVVVLSLLVAVSLAAANATQLDDTQRSFLLGNWLGSIFGKKNSTATAASATNRGLFSWFDNLFGFGHHDDDFFDDDDDFFGEDDDDWIFGGDDDDDDLFYPVPAQRPPLGKPQAPAQTKPQAPAQGKPTATSAPAAKPAVPAVPASNATSALPEAKPVDGNDTSLNVTRAWLLSNWLNHALGKNKTTRGLVGNLLGTIFGKKKPPQKQNATATNRGLGDFFADWIAKTNGGWRMLNASESSKPKTTRGFLLDSLWDTLFPHDDFPPIPIRPRPPHRPHKPHGKPSGAAAKATPAASASAPAAASGTPAAKAY